MNQENEQNGIERIIILAYDLDALLDFLSQKGFEVVMHRHATLIDLSEIYEFALNYEGNLVGAMVVHYIDSHFWPKGEINEEEMLLRLLQPVKWSVIVDPVSIAIEGPPSVPANILEDIRNYSDSLPPFPDAKLAYEQYIEDKEEFN
ncbi:hypothetical protein H5T87_01855 [bacterium]|nr:hypothetical protein [bacterium]